MTSPDPKSTQGAEGEGGGMLPALLAGAGILAVAALFIFGGDDDAKEAAENKADAKAHSSSAQTANNPKGGVAARKVDGADKTGRPKPRLNPRIADAVVTEGMAPMPHKKPEPTSWDSVDDEIAYWEDQLREANRMLEIRQRAVEHVPKQEEKIREHGTPGDLADFQRRKVVVAENLDKAQARVNEVELKLEGLR
ncbi:hypothetical protein ENSA5_51490 [Enhygromyxa salina]|uniref:Uncharacterized protein n=1 Tax=Enhygromyxa salina TaxID=215803 RepID=A0A2S9XGW5_9BACT|nr:hypothetical protein [Enhygromyxa salina]PRP92109.1 hypothetical protein ENSA5_51490 [Enhygromyxa salina]